jgi:hypothetical protein
MFRSLALLAVLALGSTAFAWNDDGHRVTGFIARFELERQKATGDAKAAHALARIDQLLAALPDHASLDMACTWPDHVRPKYADHHYIDVEVSEYAQLSVHWRPISGQQGVVRAIRESQQMLRQERTFFTNNAHPDLKESATPTEALALLSHFIGDMHMPNHIGDRNDQGGNATYIDFDETDRATGQKMPPQKLHAFWDGVVTLTHSLSKDPATRTTELQEVARKMMTDYAPSPAQIADPNIENWAQESYKLAWEVGYQLDLAHGRAVSEERTQRDGTTRTEKFTVYKANAGYKDGWKRVGLSRVTLAGYRLAEELKRCL